MCSVRTPDVSTTLPERLPIELRGGGRNASSSVCEPPAGMSSVAGASRPGELTDHVPASPPASLSSSDRVSACAGRRSPNETPDGDANRPGASAACTSIMPPPAASTLVGFLCAVSLKTGPSRQHERRLDLRRRPVGMALAQERGRAGDGGGGHARARPRAVAARDRRDDVDAGRSHVRLERERVGRRAARRERRDQPGVGRDLLARLVVDRERSSPPAAVACWASRAPTRSDTVSERCRLSATAVGSPAARCA